MLTKLSNSYKYHVAYLFIATTAIFIRFLIPQNPRLDAVHDDSLMVELAYNILQGNWLGDWNSTAHPALTLFKPPGYPLYLALCMKIGLPPAVGALIIYLMASIILVKNAFPGILKEKNKILIFGLFAFNPAFYGDGSSLIYRDILNAAILTLVIALCTLILKSPFYLKNTVYLGIILGFLMGYTSLLKDDVKYITILGFTLTVIMKLVKKYRDPSLGLGKYKTILIYVLLAVATNFALTSAIKNINYQNYGVSLIQDNTRGNFAKLLSDLSEIKTPQSSPDIFIDKNQIAAVAQYSKTFNKLKPYLDSDNIWKQISCKFNSICDQSAGFFQHELRDAFYYSNMAESANDLQNYSKQIRSEIEIACKNNKLNCSKTLNIPGIPAVLEKVNKKYVVDSFFSLNKIIFNWSYIGTANPNTLNLEDIEQRPGWSTVPGIIKGYQFHPNSERALGLTGFKEFNVWIYQILTITMIAQIVTRFQLIKSFLTDNSMTGQFYLVTSLFTFAQILMVVSNVMGWNSFSAANNYFLIFSPFVIYIYSITIIRIKM
jgi:hypothetical protein